MVSSNALPLWYQFRLFILFPACLILLCYDVIIDLNLNPNLLTDCSLGNEQTCSKSSYCEWKSTGCIDIFEPIVQIKVAPLKENEVELVGDSWLKCEKNQSIGTIHLSPKYTISMTLRPGKASKRWTSIVRIGNQQDYRQPSFKFLSGKKQILRVQLNTEKSADTGCKDSEPLESSEHYHVQLKVRPGTSALYINQKEICSFYSRTIHSKRFQNVFISSPHDTPASATIKNLRIHHEPSLQEWEGSRVILASADSHPAYTLTMDIIPFRRKNKLAGILLFGDNENFSPKLTIPENTLKVKLDISNNGKGKCISSFELPENSISHLKIVVNSFMAQLYINSTSACSFVMKSPVEFEDKPFAIFPDYLKKAEVHVRNVFMKPHDGWDLHSPRPFYMKCTGAWSSWGECSESCGSGTKTREVFWGRKSMRYVDAGLLCAPLSETEDVCNTHDCNEYIEPIALFQAPDCTKDVGLRLIGCEWMNVTEGQMLGQMSTPSAYSLSFEITPTGLEEKRANIVHFGLAQGIQVPMIGFKEYSMKLLVQVGGSVGEVEEWMEINRVYFVNISVYDDNDALKSIMKIDIDGENWLSQPIVRIGRIPDQTIYLSRPNGHQAFARVRNMQLQFDGWKDIVENDVAGIYKSYQKVDFDSKNWCIGDRKFSKQNTKCERRNIEGILIGTIQLLGCDWFDVGRSKVIGIVDIGIDFTMSFEILPKKHSKQYANVLKIGSHEDLDFPSVFLKAKTMVMVVQILTFRCESAHELIQNVATRVVLKVSQARMSLFLEFDDELVLSCEKEIKISNRFARQAIFVSDPHKHTALVSIRNFKLYQGESCSFQATSISRGPLPIVKYSMNSVTKDEFS